ncbi:MAG TPA: hypothetical protein VK436_16480 [Methanocella sp.]|nr:hypothetical protein [Methanocella sp.]
MLDTDPPKHSPAVPKGSLKNPPYTVPVNNLELETMNPPDVRLPDIKITFSHSPYSSTVISRNPKIEVVPVSCHHP